MPCSLTVCWPIELGLSTCVFKKEQFTKYPGITLPYYRFSQKTGGHILSFSFHSGKGWVCNESKKEEEPFNSC